MSDPRINFDSEKRSPLGRRHRDQLHYYLQTAFSFGEETVAETKGTAFSLWWGELNSSQRTQQDFLSNFKTQFESIRTNEAICALKPHKIEMLFQIGVLYRQAYFLDMQDQLHQKLIDAGAYQKTCLHSTMLCSTYTRELRDLGITLARMQRDVITFKSTCDAGVLKINGKKTEIIAENKTALEEKCNSVLESSKNDLADLEREIKKFESKLQTASYEDVIETARDHLITRLDQLKRALSKITSPSVPDTKTLFSIETLDTTYQRLYGEQENLKKDYQKKLAIIDKEKKSIEQEIKYISTKPFFISPREQGILMGLLRDQKNFLTHAKILKENVIATAKKQYFMGFLNSGSTVWNPGVTSITERLFTETAEMKLNFRAMHEAIDTASLQALTHLTNVSSELDHIEFDAIESSETEMKIASGTSLRDKNNLLIERVRSDFITAYTDFSTVKNSAEQEARRALQDVLRNAELEKETMIRRCAHLINRLSQIKPAEIIFENQKVVLKRTSKEAVDTQRGLVNRQTLTSVLAPAAPSLALSVNEEVKSPHAHNSLLLKAPRADVSFTPPSPKPMVASSIFSGVSSVSAISLGISFLLSGPIGWGVGLCVAGVALIAGAVILGVKAKNRNTKNKLLAKHASHHVQKTLFDRNERLKKQVSNKQLNCPFSTRRLMMRLGIVVDETQNSDNSKELRCKILTSTFPQGRSADLYLNSQTGNLSFKFKLPTNAIQHVPVTEENFREHLRNQNAPAA